MLLKPRASHGSISCYSIAKVFQKLWCLQVDGKSSVACYLMALDKCYASLCEKFERCRSNFERQRRLARSSSDSCKGNTGVLQELLAIVPQAIVQIQELLAIVSVSQDASVIDIRIWTECLRDEFGDAKSNASATGCSAIQEPIQRGGVCG